MKTKDKQNMTDLENTLQIIDLENDDIEELISTCDNDYSEEDDYSGEEYSETEYFEEPKESDEDFTMLSDVVSAEEIAEIEAEDNMPQEYYEETSKVKEEEEILIASNSDEALEIYEEERYIEEQERYVEDGYVEDYLEDGEVQMDDDVEFTDIDDLDIDEDEDEDEETILGVFGALGNKLNYILAGAAAIVLLIVVGVVAITGGKNSSAISAVSLYEVGCDYASLSNAGMQGLEAMANMAYQKETIVEEPEIVVETDASKVKVSFVSLNKDAKIKFLNSESELLIKDTEFEATLTFIEKDAKNLKEGTEFVFKDEDKDGIIFEKDMEPGKYSLTITAIDGTTFVDVPETVTVKGEVEYQVIDVADLVKSESEINAAAEDTALKDVEEEGSLLTDTVEWVESSQTSSDSNFTYEVIDKSQIIDPKISGKADILVLNEYLAAINNRPSAYINVKYTLVKDPDSVSGDTSDANTGESTGGENNKTDSNTQQTDPTPAPEKVVSVDWSNAPVTVENGKEISVTAVGKVDGVAQNAGSYTWSVTSGSDCLSLSSSNGAQASFKGIKEGKASIKVVYSITLEGKSEASTAEKSYEVEIKKASPTVDTSAALKTKDGQAVYIKDGNGNYVAATNGDYKDGQTYYVKKAGTKYTGWQTIGGNTYYYDKNGNKVTGDQVIQGVSYSFTSDGILTTNTSGILGIDVSKWNGNINWTAVKNAGIKYVIIRVGYRGSTQGSLIEDPMFRTNIQGAKAAGLKVGLYFFTQAVTEAEAVQEASMCVNLAKTYGGVSYPIFIDTESAGGAGRADGLSKSQRTAVCRAFCQTVQNSGYTAGVYASKSWFTNKVDYNQLNGYRIWLAQYYSKATLAGRYDLWQYTDKGSIAGVPGNVDLNMSYLGY